MSRSLKLWFSATTTATSLLLVNPLYAWAGLPSPLIGSPSGSSPAKVLLFVISFWGIRYAIESPLKFILGALLPTWIYIADKKEDAQSLSEFIPHHQTNSNEHKR